MGAWRFPRQVDIPGDAGDTGPDLQIGPQADLFGSDELEDRDPAWEARVLKTFTRHGRLWRIPAKRRKRMVVLRWLADHFRPAERYAEAQVNEILLRYHDDPALLRRLMVNEELMQRYGGLYWRAGTLPYPAAGQAAARPPP